MTMKAMKKVLVSALAAALVVTAAAPMIFIFFCRMIFKILAQITMRSGFFDRLDRILSDHKLPIFDLFLYLLYITFCQLLPHDYSLFSYICCSNFPLFIHLLNVSTVSCGIKARIPIKQQLKRVHLSKHSSVSILHFSMHLSSGSVSPSVSEKTLPVHRLSLLPQTFSQR